MGAIRDSANEHRAAKARAEILRDWLHSIHAACLWQQKVPRVGVVEAWTVNARVFLLMNFSGDAGFELYIPASDSNKTAETLAAAVKYLKGEK